MTTTDRASALPDRAAAKAAEISDALAMPEPLLTEGDRGSSGPRWRDQSLAKGAAGIAVLHASRARHGSSRISSGQSAISCANRPL